MNYTDGSRCSDQLQRSTTVMLHCSAPRSVVQSTAPLPPIDTLAEYSPSYISNVDEPTTCVYVLHWYTPLVCSAYRRVTDELSWRNRNSNSQTTLTPSQRRSQTERREQLERELEEEAGEDEMQNEDRQVAVSDANSDVLREYLNCIAAMSEPTAVAGSYRSPCAAYLPSSSRLVLHASERGDEVT